MIIVQKLKTALHYTVGKMCEEQEVDSNIHFDKEMIGTLNEIVWRQIKIFGQDLEAFAK